MYIHFYKSHRVTIADVGGIDDTHRKQVACGPFAKSEVPDLTLIRACESIPMMYAGGPLYEKDTLKVQKFLGDAMPS